MYTNLIKMMIDKKRNTLKNNNNRNRNGITHEHKNSTKTIELSISYCLKNRLKTGMKNKNYAMI